MKRVAIAGSTGSIGRQALDVVATESDLQVTALAARSSCELLLKQAWEFRPELVVIVDETAASALRGNLPPGTRLGVGEKALEELPLASDVVLNAIVGFAGLRVTLATVSAGKTLALANKESLVAAGPLVKERLAASSSTLVPVDSEHSAIFQCLMSCRPAWLSRLVITSSGGPFRDFEEAQLASVTPEQALRHPTWNMGAKITVDSSTLVNKGLEVIEAHYLFDVPYENIDVVIHPQSIVHSMVMLSDGAIMAQLSLPDMRVPIAFALLYPERSQQARGVLEFDKDIVLSFRRPNLRLFKGLALAYEAGKRGGLHPLYFNAANEVAVDLFLKREIAWTAIADLIEETLSATPLIQRFPDSLEELVAYDRQAREQARKAARARLSIT
jgi:1-deoxy-D-xylulose-5-phosphate reductoisomerase